MLTISKKFSLFFCITAAVVLLVLGGLQPVQAQENYKIGISQLVEHPALDAARNGFLEGLAEEGFTEGDNLKVLHENAQADFATAQTIAQKFKRQDLDLVLAITTKSAQAAANVLSKTPLLITAVTDPVAAGLVEDMENPGNNITGTTDMNPVKDQLQLIKSFCPDATDIGILYNSGEINSKVQVDIAKKVAPELGFTIHEGTVTNTSEVGLATSSLVNKVDAFYIPTDNVIASAIPSVMKITNEKGVPVFGSEEGQVKQGAVATRGINYFALGKQTGKMAAKVLRGTATSDLPIEGSNNLDLIVNKKACESLGLEIPPEIEKEADKIIK